MVVIRDDAEIIGTDDRSIFSWMGYTDNRLSRQRKPRASSFYAAMPQSKNNVLKIIQEKVLFSSIIWKKVL